MLNQADGTPFLSPEQIRDTWIDFFGQMERGRRLSWQEYARVWKECRGPFRQRAVTLRPMDILCLTELETAFRRVKKGKALGLDGVPPELCNACPTILAKQYDSALLKLVARGQEAMQRKGRVLVPAYKGKGPKTDPSSHRSLLISSHMGKVLHRTIRQHQEHLYETYLCTQQ